MRNIITTLVGALIIFIFQAMSWMVLPIHKDAMKYTPAEEGIMTALNSGLNEHAVYHIPGNPPGISKDREEEIRVSMIGKPTALIIYNPATEDNMAKSMLIGYILNFIAVWLVVLIINLAPQTFNTFSLKFALTMIFAMFTLMQSTLMAWNWWNTPWHYLSGEAIDLVISWALAGIWIAWFMGRSAKTA